MNNKGRRLLYQSFKVLIMLVIISILTAIAIPQIHSVYYFVIFRGTFGVGPPRDAEQGMLMQPLIETKLASLTDREIETKRELDSLRLEKEHLLSDLSGVTTPEKFNQRLQKLNDLNEEIEGVEALYQLRSKELKRGLAVVRHFVYTKSRNFLPNS